MADVEMLRKLGKIRRFKKNQVLFMQNDPGDNMYIALAGSFGVYINSFTDFPMRVAGIKNGMFFGEMSVIDGWPRSATIISEEDGSALAIDSNDFEPLLQGSPEIESAILKTLIERVATTTEAVRIAGVIVSELPSHLQDPQPQSIKEMHQIMIQLAQRIRELNDLLVAGEEVSTPLETMSKGVVTLLPERYVPFNIDDQNNNIEYLTQKDTVCPHCRIQSEAYIPLYSRLVLKETTIDQRIIYEDFDILWYTNVVCPNCNYTDTYQEFTKLNEASTKPLFVGSQFENSEGFTGFATTHKHTLDEVLKSYYLNIECLKRLSGDPSRLAKAWLKLYWIYRDYNSEALMKQSASEALSLYISYLELKDERLGTEDKMMLHAILGELSISLGKYEEALKYFLKNTVIGRTLKNDLFNQSKERYEGLRDM